MNPATASVLTPAGEPAAQKQTGRGPLAQLLHALNQPLTGLQCSLEVALASPRTVPQYVQGLRDGLELTARMRLLVEAIREVAELPEAGEDELAAAGEKVDLRAILLETIEDLRPVAETEHVAITVEPGQGREMAVLLPRQLVRGILFRLLESALAWALSGTAVHGTFAREGQEVLLQFSWQGRRAEFASVLSRAELGLLVAQAQWQHCGGIWEHSEAGARRQLKLRFRDLS